MKFLSLQNAIRFMVAIGVIAIFVVAVQSCQSTTIPNKSVRAEQIKALSGFRQDSLKRLQFLREPPNQPRSEFVNGAGQSMRLYDYTGDYLLVNVWATWCGPCIIEMPSLEALAAKNFANLNVITISMDSDDQLVDDFFEKQNLQNLTRWRDPNMNLAPKLGAKGIPVTIIYDRQGNEVARVPGEADWNSEEAIGLIKTIIGEE